MEGQEELCKHCAKADSCEEQKTETLKCHFSVEDDEQIYHVTDIFRLILKCKLIRRFHIKNTQAEPEEEGTGTSLCSQSGADISGL